jgi:hypothetical protein
VGLLLEMNGFLWAFLLTFVGVHLVTGWWSSAIPFGAIAGLASHATAQFRKRRQLVLRTSPASKQADCFLPDLQQFRAARDVAAAPAQLRATVQNNLVFAVEPRE